MHTGKTLPSGSTSLLVLSLLASGDKYGYEMISVLEDRSDHTFTLKEGTLYPILHGLEREGAVSAYEKEAPSGKSFIPLLISSGCGIPGIMASKTIEQL